MFETINLIPYNFESSSLSPVYISVNAAFYNQINYSYILLYTTKLPCNSTNIYLLDLTRLKQAL